jgi:DNA-directed RNA polymerase subunit E'/Rpb7|tara:strand:- start:1037 stop:1792 length:756 start_codon:yes stop_codon:yes gene_type:complete
MSNDLFTPIKFTTNIYLKPCELTSDYENLLLKKIVDKMEGSCTKFGYIKKNSLKIVKRSIGNIIKQHFNGNILFDLQCIAEICNPINGTIVKCIIKNKNSMGLLAQGYYNDEPILEIIIPKISAGIMSEINLDILSIGQEILVEVCGKKFNLYDKSISIIAKAIKDKKINTINNSVQLDDDEKDDDEEQENQIDDFDILEDDEKDDDDNDEDSNNDESEEELSEEEEEDLDDEELDEDNDLYEDIEESLND